MGERGEKGRGIITDPRVVRYVAGLVRNIIYFSLHRQFLWHTYNQQSQRRYPLEDGWGGARALDSVVPTYTIEVSPPRKTADNIYDIDYRVINMQVYNRRQIVRVELVIGYTVVARIVGDGLETGCFKLDLNQHPQFMDTDLTYNVFAWDDTFNCVPSIERFILQES